jgi:hypothetical protein
MGPFSLALAKGALGLALPEASGEEGLMSIAYTVTAAFDDLSVAGEYVRWLQEGHLAEVLEGGAAEATLVRLEPTAAAPLRFEVRYRFPSMAVFQRYEAEFAPRLRAEGLAKFPASRGVRMSRSLGEVLVTKVHP